MAVRTQLPQRVEEYLARLQAGEENHWLVYEACKILRPATLEALANALPGAPASLLADGWEEWRRTKRGISKDGLAAG